MKKCLECNSEVSVDKNICDKCGYKFNKSNSFVFGAFIVKTILICYVVGVFVLCYYFLKDSVGLNSVDYTKEEECMLSCSPKGYIYEEKENICTCVSHQEEMNNRCKLDCKSDKFYVNDEYHCVCDGGERVYSGGTLIYSNEIEYEYEDNFNKWLQDARGSDVFVTIIANSYCGHCVKYQPIVHNLWNRYKFKLHVLHTDKLSESEYDELFSFDLNNYDGTPYTFIMLNGEVVDYLNGVVTKDTLEGFLNFNNVINN